MLDRVRRPRGVVLVAALVIPLLVLAAGVAALARSGGAGGDTAAAEGLPVNRSDAPVLDPAVVKKDAAALVQRTPKELPTQRLAQGLVPPTNRWYSGLVFGAEAQPVFPLPLGFVLRENGFAFGVPRIQSNEKGVVGSAPTDVSVTVDGVKTGVVTRTDDLSVTVELRDASGRALARVTIAQGTPSITLEALAKTRVGMTPAPRGADLAVTVENRSYAALTDGASVDGASVSVKPGGQVTWFAVPDGGDPRTMAGLVTPVTSGSGCAPGRREDGDHHADLVRSLRAGPPLRGDAAPGRRPARGGRLRPGHLPLGARHAAGVPRRGADLVGARAPGHHRPRPVGAVGPGT